MKSQYTTSFYVRNSGNKYFLQCISLWLPWLWVHCPKNNLNLRITTEPIARLEWMQQYVRLFCLHVHCTVYLAQKPDIYSCISLQCDRRSFYVEIPIYFGTVWKCIGAGPISAGTDQPVCYTWTVLSLLQQLVQCALHLHCTKLEHNFKPKVVPKLQYWLGRLVHTI